MTIASHASRRPTLSITLLSVSLLAVSTPILAKELRLGLITPPQHIWTQTAERFADEVAERSDGEMAIALFPSGQMGDESAMFSQMETGLLDMGIMTAALTSQREPSVVGWFTPFLFNSVAQAAEVADTDAAQQMLRNLEDKGLHAFGYTFAGMRHILMRDEQIESAADVAGKNMRIIPFSAMNAWWRAVDARPMPISLPDVYQGLQNGMLDGVDIDLDALVGSGFYEVAEHLTLTNHMAFPAVSVMSQATRASLSDEQRQLIDAAMEDALAWGIESQIEAEERNLTMLEDRINVYTLENAEDTFSTANQAFAERFGDHPLIQAFQQQSTELLNAE
ncbi:TRAP transporter substrate-binding protein [Halomonas sp. ATBC28]|uniref:TRAP transporter substrate-binding protein n=1 Tax=Halomonas sp. ATBC28 TaxID=2545264 RepID=UPI00105D43B3|nr:TRAP transporter substrate-binding protein [Halomonas sp. ATBC28]TDV97140.1 tripartite ATP-independent transporter DctP family solute receptor [Halomonas alkaliantarctica]TMU28439.1 TRAP transporter substrate-binding protein [Halomonas sp. ATBC28]